MPPYGAGVKKRMPIALASGAAMCFSSHPPLHSCVVVADDYLFILVLIGDSGVGKSCLLLRFAVCTAAMPLARGRVVAALPRYHRRAAPHRW